MNYDGEDKDDNLSDLAVQWSRDYVALLTIVDKSHKSNYEFGGSQRVALNNIRNSCLVISWFVAKGWQQSVTSRLETSRYRDFSQFFESIGLGLENFDLEKKSRYRSRKYLVSKKSLGIGLENI